MQKVHSFGGSDATNVFLGSHPFLSNYFIIVYRGTPTSPSWTGLRYFVLFFTLLYQFCPNLKGGVIITLVQRWNNILEWSLTVLPSPSLFVVIM